MPTGNVVLTDHQEGFIEALVQSGRYQNASEVLREGLRMVERRVALDDAKLDALRAAANLGALAIERREFKEFSDAATLTAHLDALADYSLSGSETE